jgi:hypothetical protein
MNPQNIHTGIEILGGIVTIASICANFFPPNTIAFKILHGIALNGPGIQSAVRAAVEPKPPVVK